MPEATDPRNGKRSGRGLAPTPLAALLNLIHFIIATVCSIGSYVLDTSMLPLTIMLSIGVLSRYHDYCWLTKITQAVEVVGEACRDADILPHAPFFNDISDKFFDESVGDRIWTNLTGIIIGVNVCVAVYRLSARYKFAIVPDKVFGRIVLFGLLTWFVSELYIYTVYEHKPLCEMCSVDDATDEVLAFTLASTLPSLPPKVESG